MEDAGWAVEVLAAIGDDCWMTKLLVTRGIVTKLRWQLEALTERMQKLEGWCPVWNFSYIFMACLAAMKENQARMLANPQAVEERYQFPTLLEAFLAHVERCGIFAEPTVINKTGLRSGHMGLTFAEEIEGIQQGIAMRRFTPVLVLRLLRDGWDTQRTRWSSPENPWMRTAVRRAIIINCSLPALG